MPARGVVINGELLAEVLERRGVSASELSKRAEVSHATVVRLLHNERTAGRRIRDKLAEALYRLGEPRHVVEQVFPVVPRGRTLCVRKVPDSLFRLIKQACRHLRAPNREVLVRPFHQAYPFTPIDVVQAVRSHVRRRGLKFEDFVVGHVPDAPVLEPTTGEGVVPMSIAGIPEEWYMAWRVAMARHNKPAADVLGEVFDLSSPFPPGVVVEAAERQAEAERVTLNAWVSRLLGRTPWM